MVMIVRTVHIHMILLTRLQLCWDCRRCGAAPLIVQVKRWI